MAVLLLLGNGSILILLLVKLLLKVFYGFGHLILSTLRIGASGSLIEQTLDICVATCHIFEQAGCSILTVGVRLLFGLVFILHKWRDSLADLRL